MASVGNDISTDQTPLIDRWGGWYMTGAHSESRSLGNWKSPMLTHEVGNLKNYLSRLELSSQTEVGDLSKFFNLDAYLSPHSDVVALMVLTHQANLHNVIASANQESRKAGFDRGNGLERAAEPLVRAMLFVNEAPLSGPMKGSSTFASEFSSRGPRDRHGRSLRDFNLKQRLFEYPMSYLIYSAGFDALPQLAKHYVYRRFREILSGEDQSPAFAHLSKSSRQAILEILQDTKPEFAETRN
jgi:hypothetical protein